MFVNICCLFLGSLPTCCKCNMESSSNNKTKQTTCDFRHVGHRRRQQHPRVVDKLDMQEAERERRESQRKSCALLLDFLPGPETLSVLLNIKRNDNSFYVLSVNFPVLHSINFCAMRLKSRKQFVKSDSSHLHLRFSFAELSIL